MTVTAPGPFMRELGRVEQALRDAEASRAEYDSKRTERVQEVSRKKAEKAAEAERVGAGGEPDKKLEQKLLRELRELESGLAVRSVNYPQPGIGDGPAVPDFRAELYDEDAEAMYAGADDAVKKAEADLRAFAREHTARLAVELEPRAVEIRERVTGWLRDGRRLAQEEAGILGVFARLFVLSDREALLGTSPPSPFDFLNDAPREGVLPLPECFIR